MSALPEDPVSTCLAAASRWQHSLQHLALSMTAMIISASSPPSSSTRSLSTMRVISQALQGGSLLQTASPVCE